MYLKLYYIFDMIVLRESVSMALRILWDIYESVILIDALINVLNNNIPRK